MRNNKGFNRNYIYIGLFLLLIVGVSLGYSALKTTLNINGSTKINKNSWVVHFKNLNVTTGSFLNENNNTVLLSENDTKLTYTVTLKEPGDFYEFTVDIANDGSLDALLEDVRNTTSIKVYDSVNDEWNDFSGEESSLKFITHTITGIPAENSVLEPGTANYKNVKVRVDYPQDISAADLPGSDYSITKTIELDYVQNK